MMVEKSETAHRHGGENGYPAAIDSGEATDGQLCTGSFTVIYGYAAAQDDQSRHGTDDGVTNTSKMPKNPCFTGFFVSAQA